MWAVQSCVHSLLHSHWQDEQLLKVEWALDRVHFQVGIGVVMLRKGPAKHDGSQAAEVLLVRRAKAPEIGKWTVPGGSLELGEEAGFSVKLTPCTYRYLTAAAAAYLLTVSVAHQLSWCTFWMCLTAGHPLALLVDVAILIPLQERPWWTVPSGRLLKRRACIFAMMLKQAPIPCSSSRELSLGDECSGLTDSSVKLSAFF